MKMQLLVMLAAAGLSATAVAGESPDATSDVYVEGALGTAFLRLSDRTQHMSDNTAGARIAVGKRFGARLGVEGGYTHFGEMNTNLGMVAAKVKPDAVYIATTYALPLTDKLSSQFKLGVARTGTTGTVAMSKDAVTIDTRRVSAVMGVGVSYALSAHWAVTADYAYYGKVVRADKGAEALKAAQLTAGLRYAF